jgi:hypothetical protein
MVASTTADESPSMLRIDEKSKTLVAPQASQYVPEEGPGRDELHALLSAGWEAFAGEIGQPQLKAIAPMPEAGVDILAMDEAAGRVTVVIVAEGDASDAVARGLAAAATVSSWDAEHLGGLHQALQTVTPGDSPRIIVVGPTFDEKATRTVDWLVRRHGLEITAYGVEALRFGNERMMNFVASYPAAAEFVASVADGVPSVPPPPGAPAAPVDLPAPPAA